MNKKVIDEGFFHKKAINFKLKIKLQAGFLRPTFIFKN